MHKAEIPTEKEIELLLGELTVELHKLYGDYLKSIILYGSYARGDYDSDSDIDIMALLNLDTLDQAKYSKALVETVTELSLKYDILVSVMENNASDFLNRASYVPFYRNVYEEGVRIYGD